MTHYEQPRLSRKTLRSSDLTTSVTAVQRTGEGKALAEGRKFAFASKVVLKPRKLTEAPAGETKPSGGLARTQKTRFSPSLSRLSFVPRQATPTRYHTPSPVFSQTLTPYAQSLQVSREASPRGLLTISAINLELELTALLAQTETRPSPQRTRDALAAHMKVLQSLSLRDPAFGPFLSQLHSSLSHLLQSTRIKEVSELLERNQDLSRYISDQKRVLQQEAGEKAAGDRVYETLRKEKALLEKKVGELQMHYRRTEARVGDKKTGELEELLKAARKRELRLLRLLEGSKPSSIPPIDLLLAQDFSPHSSNSSCDSTEELSPATSSP